MNVIYCSSLCYFSAVFTWTNLLVVVVELDGSESEALDLVPLVTNTVLEEHQLIVGVVVVVDPGSLTILLSFKQFLIKLRMFFVLIKYDRYCANQ